MILTLAGAIVIGLSLGLLGSGGSILTVPLLTYIVERPPKVAIAESLVIVGGIALVGVWRQHRAAQVAWAKVVSFGLPSMLGTYVGALLSQYLSGLFQLALFAVIMLLASRFMLKPMQVTTSTHVSLIRLIPAALIVGAVAGLVGVGGGFLIVPALLAFGGVSMREAVGTSLAIIVMQSIVGFSKYYWLFSQQGALPFDYKLIALMVAVGAAGSVFGAAMGGRLPQQQLKRGFGVMLIVMGSFIFVSSLYAMFTTEVVA
ncbi:sulfite exporter TauE/SafE family protein [Alteromonas lipolytica]|uniref:Probable membrane transporter protein n=1 Tax=Alteromonas lipolytica TaxID=1856405 RepID=A0A1E8FB32_9ALTE|nr:sulfite exporter TauE/SafE family protein [Alteromonas lipolytica]OFI33142.1 hypothetical protein BFC17_02460 [Alteromonas lipolytica]GGF62116.1 UPF0721 transmembrane protein [Alteromonas lipolytica]